MAPLMPFVKGMIVILAVATAVEGVIWWRNVHPHEEDPLEV